MVTRGGYEPGQFCWVDLAAADMKAAAGFYGGLFGWTVDLQDTEGGPPYGMFVNDGDVVAGLGELDPSMKRSGVPPMWNHYISVADADEVVGKIERAGGTVTVPVMQVLDAGRLAFFQDPTGGHAAIWEAGTHRGASRVNEPGTLCWNELATRDLAGAESFYGDVFGWDFHDNPASPSKYSVCRVAGRDNGGILLMTDEWGDVPPHWSAYFAVADVDGAVRTIEASGGGVHHGPFETPVGRMAVVADPQGASFHVIQLRGED